MINVRQKTAILLEEKMGIRPEQTKQMFEDNVLSENYCIRVLVAHEFKSMVRNGKSKTEAKILLSDRYCVSYRTVENYIVQIMNGQADMQ